MGIFQNKVNGAGTFLKSGLESMLAQTTEENIAGKLGALKDQLAKEGINNTTENYKFTLHYDEKLESIETIFHFNGNSQGYDTQGMQKAKSALIDKKWEQTEKKFDFHSGSYRLWAEKDNVRLKLEHSGMIGGKAFDSYVNACENIYNFMVGGENKKTERPSDERILKEPPNADHFYRSIMARFHNNNLEKGDRFETEYEGKKVVVFIGGRDPSTYKLHAQIRVNLKEDDVANYKTKHRDSPQNKNKFDAVGTENAMCIEENVQSADANKIGELLKRLISSYQDLRNMYPNC